ncbi:MAG: MoxR family ATPase [Thermofilum sp.]|uniref:MoxR family ATPase n=1 Tax=Thermofilum pendens TaxID=2269 RepID=A0A7C4D453_THEPE
MRDYGKTFEKLFEEVGQVIVGKQRVIERLCVALLARGHVLIEDYPGMAKTLLALTFSRATDLAFKRIQFTPDLLPADITGSFIYDPTAREFKFRRGPVFANVVLADEINRAPPKTQAALLEVMMERQVTVDGQTFKVDEPFMVIATLNPIEYEGTYPLPEAQLDRFMLKVSIGYPSFEEEVEILKRRILRRQDSPQVKSVLSREEVLELQRRVEEVYVDSSILEYIVSIARKTRELREVAVGASPRGSETLMKAARALALIRGRDYVLPDDVKELAVEVLAHRLVLRAEGLAWGLSAEDLVREVVSKVEVPREYRSSERA